MVSPGQPRSSPFAITAATNSLRLDAGQTAVTTFTVSNSGSQPINGRAVVRWQSPQAVGWFTLAGTAERLFAPNDAAQFSVNIAVPAGAPAGAYTFSIDMVGVENPDEVFSQGPPVSLEVAAVEAPKKSLPWWWWIPVAALGVLVVAVLAFILLRGGDDSSSVTGSRTLSASAPIDVDSSDAVTQPSAKDDLQYLVSGSAHVIGAFNGARIFKVSTGSAAAKPEDCPDSADGSDVGLVTVNSGTVTSMCVRSNTGALSLVAVSLQASGGKVSPKDLINAASANKFLPLVALTPVTSSGKALSPAELAALQELMKGVVGPAKPPQQFNLKLSYTTQGQ
jgi:hypothetical protein